MVIPDRVRRAALWPPVDHPDPPPEHPFRLLRREGFTIGFFPDTSVGWAYPEVVATDRVDAMVGEVRSLLAEQGKTRIAWFVSEEARPADLAARLSGLGMTPYEEPPFEPRFAAMALLAEPLLGPPDIDAHPVGSLAEYRAGHRLANDVFQMSEEDRRALEAREQVLWELESSGRSPVRSFVAVIDGEVVGSAACVFGANSLYLIGGSTREDKRGRGVYRALVRARWDTAVEHGTPALTVSAGRYSRPILERLGFTIVGWSDCLLDPLG